MNRISRNLTTLYRTESLIARRRLSVLQRQTVLFAAAGLAGLAGLILVNVALYLALANLISAPAAAALLALGNLVLAGLLALIASRTDAEAEIAPAVAVRDMAIAELHADLDEMGEDLRGIVDHVRGLRADPLGAILPLILPLVMSLIRKKTD